LISIAIIARRFSSNFGVHNSRSRAFRGMRKMHVFQCSIGTVYSYLPVVKDIKGVLSDGLGAIQT